jgi:hypothetical protein
MHPVFENPGIHQSIIKQKVIGMIDRTIQDLCVPTEWKGNRCMRYVDIGLKNTVHISADNKI